MTLPEANDFRSPGRYDCPECGRTLARYERAATVTETGWHDEEGSWTEQHETPIGGKLALEAGFVNARRRHPSGHAHYVRSKHAWSAPLQARRPAVITCACGQDLLIDRVPEDWRDYAGADPERRAELLMRALEDEAGDRWTEAQIDELQGR